MNPSNKLVKNLLCMFFSANIPIMLRWFYHRVSLGVLILYLIYALSPKYASVMESGSHSVSPASAQEKTVVHGILWLSILGEELMTDIDQSAGSDASFCSSPDNDNLFLIKKKRAMHRERFDASPHIQVEVISSDLRPAPQPLTYTFEVPHDPIHSQIDDYYSVCTGLAPPAPLS